MADTKISDMAEATTLTSAYFDIIQGGTNKRLPAALITDAIDDAIAAIPPSSSSFPAGVLMPFAGTVEPSGWLFAYGQAVSRATYSALFTAIGTVYGSGDGSTTFNLPDLRGRVVAGQDDMGGSSANRLTNQSGGVEGDTLGATGGVETHTLTTAQLPSHTHHIDVVNATGAGSSYRNTAAWEDGLGGSDAGIYTDASGSGTAHNNVQPTIVLNYIIATGA